MGKNMSFAEGRELVLSELRTSLESIDSEQAEQLLEAVLSARKVFFVGEITEPAITAEDLLIVGSGSGTTLFPAGIAQKAHKIGAKVVHIGSNPNSDLKDIAAFMVRIPVRTKYYLEDEIDSRQPMTSLFEQTLLLLGDIVAKMIIERRELDMKALWQYHANLE